MRCVLHSLSHTFAGNPPRPALKNLTLELPSGQFVAVIGPSGCGKSTLLRIIAGLQQPSAGKVLLDGQTPEAMRAKRRIAWAAQSPALLPWLNARANVALALRYHTADAPARLTPQEALQRVGLAEAAEVYPFHLSGGMQQRVALARLLMQDAALWLMDEPFAALDEMTRERLVSELVDLWHPLQPSVIWVTHAITEAVRLADRVLVLSGAPARLVADLVVGLPRPRSEATPEFQAVAARLRTALSSTQVDL